MHQAILGGVSLASHANAILKHGMACPAALHGPAETMRKLNSARFTLRRTHPEAFVIGAAGWIEQLEQRGARRARLWIFESGITPPDSWAACWQRSRNARCAVQIDLRDASELWVIKDDACRLIECAQVPRADAEALAPDLSASGLALREALEGMRAFAQEKGQPQRAKACEAALAQLDRSSEAADGEIPLLAVLPAAWADPAARLVLAAVHAAFEACDRRLRSLRPETDAGAEPFEAAIRAACYRSIVAAVNAQA